MTPSQRAYVIGVIRHDAPRALIAAAVVGALVTAVRLVIPPGLSAGRVALSIAVLLMLLAGAVAIRGHRLPDRAVPWVFAAVVTVMVLWLLSEFWQDPRVVAFSYIIIVMVTYGLWLMAWPPFLASAGVMLIGGVAVLMGREVPDRVDWILAFIAALAGGGMLMRLRLASMLALADAHEETSRLATTDPLTGVLNRNGLDALVTPLVSTAQRTGTEVAVCFVDIDGLKSANDRFGHEFGDEVITTVARCVASSVRTNDLVARWGGDEFVVIGLADDDHFGDLESRIRRAIALSEIDLTRWPGGITLGSARGRIHEVGFDAMITMADEAMYRERQRRRAEA